MYRIAQNIWYDTGRAAKVRGEKADLDVIADWPGSDGRTVTEDRLTLAHVLQEIEKLPQDQQVLVGLVCVNGLSYKEAAETLQLPIGTVMSRLSRARQAIAGALIDTGVAIVPASGGARLGKNS
jgi:RNA polymerase sigma-70 factor (ECF subfamily)